MPVCFSLSPAMACQVEATALTKHSMWIGTARAPRVSDAATAAVGHRSVGVDDVGRSTVWRTGSSRV